MIKKYKNTIMLTPFILMNVYCLILLGQDFGFSVRHTWNDFLNFYPRVLQDIIFFFALVSLYKFNFKFLLGVIPLAFIETTGSFINLYIHPLIVKIGLISLFSAQPDNVSPEYTRIFIFIGIFIIYCIKWFKKKSFNTIFLTLSMAGVLGTSILFHAITLSQINYYTKEQEKILKSFIEQTNSEIILTQCKSLGLYCTIDNVNSNQLFSKNYPIPISNFETIVTSYWDKSTMYFYYTIANDNKIMSRIFARKPVAFIKNQSLKMIVIDENNYTQYLRFNEIIFGSLAMASHLVWIFGALYLIYFHENKLKKKANIYLKENILNK